MNRGARETSEEGRGQSRGWKVAYQNVGGRIKAMNIVLEMERQKRWDFIFVGEVSEGKRGEGTTQQYRTLCKKGSRVVLYIKEEVVRTTYGQVTSLA